MQPAPRRDRLHRRAEGDDAVRRAQCAIGREVNLVLPDGDLVMIRLGADAHRAHQPDDIALHRRRIPTGGIEVAAAVPFGRADAARHPAAAGRTRSPARPT